MTAVVAVTLTVVVAVASQPGRRWLSRGVAALEQETPELRQARWKFSAGPAGGVGRITKQQSRDVRQQRRPLRTTITSIYDALFVRPADLPPLLRTSFTPAAARSFKRARAGVAVAEAARSVYRSAEVAVQPSHGARRAVASVSVRAAEVGKRQRMLHRATLWLERPKKAWKVVAFEIVQKPVAPRQAGSKKT